MRKRPLLITIICIIGWLMVVLTFLDAFSPAIKKLGQFYPALYSLVTCLQFISFVGIWYMKRWGVELFIASFFAKMILFVFMGNISYTSITFILSAAFVILLMIYYRKMDVNL
jgi:hypothetical protein